jgi:predicted phage terminase large subunit-like protein
MLERYETERRVAVILPRSWLKSTVCSISYPIWRTIRDVNVTVLLVQNTANNAAAKLRTIRNQFDGNGLLRILFPEILPTRKCRWTSVALELNRTQAQPEANFECAGRNTQVVGRHYNLIIEDDTVAPDKDEYTEMNVLPTKDDVQQAIGWHNSAIPLLVDFRKDQILVVGTRWFQVDLLSWIRDHEEGYSWYVRAIRETNGKSDPQGQFAWPERFGEKDSAELERSIGPYLYSCLYLNNPLHEDQMVFQPKWFEFYDTHPKKLVKYTCVDPAGNPKNSTAKRKKKSDANVVMTIGKDEKTGLVYVLDYTEFRGGPGELLDELFRQVKEWKPTKVGIEGIAYQEALEHFVTQKMLNDNFFFNLVLIKHSGSNDSAKKEWRIRSLQPLIRTKTIRFKYWMQGLVSQLQVFPLGAHDDLADTLSMFLQLLDINVVGEAEDQSDQIAGFEVEEAVRSIAAKLRPEQGSVFDVMQQPVEGQTLRDPYEHLFSNN